MQFLGLGGGLGLSRLSRAFLAQRGEFSYVSFVGDDEATLAKSDSSLSWPCLRFEDASREKIDGQS